jgi:eukaryotic-like serine/threonine-protein kinase
VDERLSPGDQVGEYAIEEVIGDGGFGTVYRAVHSVIGKHAALKVLHRKLCADPQSVSRFIEEARAVNRIGHRNIVDIFSFGQLGDGRHYHLMELLEGRTLAAFLDERGALAVGEVLAILGPIARALDAAHGRGIAHRDLKPDNILLVEDEDGLVPKLIDFGLAKILTGDVRPDGRTAPRTRTGALLGTPAYMSPEQCRGRVVDHKTDVYAFGVVAYRMLTGRVPFAGEDSLEVMMKHATERPEAPSRVRRDLPAEVDAAILAMLEKRPERRPADMATAFSALESALRMRPRSALGGWLLLAAGVALVAGIIVAVIARDRAPRVPAAALPTPAPPVVATVPDAAADAADPVELEIESTTPPDAAAPRRANPKTHAPTDPREPDEPPGPEDAEDPFR